MGPWRYLNTICPWKLTLSMNKAINAGTLIVALYMVLLYCEKFLIYLKNPRVYGFSK
jgi:hypothetical protein